MRISDWSSDVCSSDLSGVRKMRAWPRLSPLARPASPGASTPPAILARLFLRPAAMQGPTFQQLIQKLNAYWAAQGCVLVQPLDLEVGAGTFHPATFLRSLGPEPWNAAYVQPCRRPTDGRYGQNPNRLQRYYQYQVVMKPSPDNIVELYFESLKELGVDPLVHDLRLVEDNWESPPPGAWDPPLLAALPPPPRRPLRPEPPPPATLLPVPGGEEALARQQRRTVLRGAEGTGRRPAGARPAPGRGQLGIAHARRLGPGLGSVVERDGDHPVHLLPAGWRPGVQAGAGRDHLRPGTAVHVPAERRRRVRHRLDPRSRRRAGHLPRRLPPERGRAERVQLRARGRCRAVPPLRRLRGRGPAPGRTRPAAARLRAGDEGLAQLQPARRAPRDLRHRAPAHHPARAQAVAGGGRELPGAAREARVPGVEASGQSRVNSLPPLQGEGWGGDGFPQRRGDLQANPSPPKSSP